MADVWLKRTSRDEPTLRGTGPRPCRSVPGVMARVRALAVVGLSALGILSGLASAASAATTCKTVALLAGRA
jgi:hypothetical protein